MSPILLEPSTHVACRVEPIHKEVDTQRLAQAETALLQVYGMGCPACAMRVYNGLLGIEGVLTVDVLLQYGLAWVWYDPTQVQPETLPDLFPLVTADGKHHYTAQLLSI